MWNEIAHIELMLRHADDGKPIYTKLTTNELDRMGIPFDRTFTEPIFRIDQGQDDYLFRLYKGPNKIDDKTLLEQLLENTKTTY